MLLDREKAFLLELLKGKDAEEMVMFTIKQYADMSVQNARLLLEVIPKIADAAIRIMAKDAADKALAAFWLMGQRKMEPDESGTYFASMVPVCKVLFPNGSYDGSCVAEAEYWELFIKQFQNPKVFSWSKDAGWAENYGYTDYLKLVEENLREKQP